MTIFITNYELAQVFPLSFGQPSPPLVLLYVIISLEIDPYISENGAIRIVLFVCV